MAAKLLYILFTFILASAYQTSYAQIVEICDNGLDDDGDGLFDLNDPDCICQSTPISHIPNPSFEDINCCPTGNSQLSCADTWVQASDATTDYFNRCGYFEREQFPVPLPIPDGNAYIGFRNGHFSRSSPYNTPDNSYDPNPNWKEYTGACLLAPLEAGTQYTIQFSIGFVDYNISPSMSVVLYGTTDCDNLPFGVGNREFGCPTNGSGWQVLGQVHVSGNMEWKQYEISTIPRQDIVAIAIGPDCIELDLDVNPYYFLDNLVLADSELFGPTIQKVGHPCSPDFRIIASEKQNASYQWYRDGVAIVGASDRELWIGGIEGKYEVLVKIDSNCVLSAPFNYAIPVYRTQSRVVICPEEVLRFGGETLARSGNYSHTFQTGDGCDSLVDLELIILKEKMDSVKAYFFEGETFSVGPYNFYSPGTANLTLSSSRGCDSLVHLTLEEYRLYIPNAFSPNGDGINDYFTVYGSEDFIDIQSLRIYDRWGKRVYSIQKGSSYRWDGTDNGVEISSGVYIYVLDLILHDGTKKMIKGDVMLLK